MTTSLKTVSCKPVILIIIAMIFCSCNNKTEKDGVTFEKDGCFYITAFLNDSIEGRFIFDTGAGGLYIDSTFLEKHKSLSKSTLDTAQMRGAGSSKLKTVFIIKDSIKVSIGNNSRSFINSPILKLTDINGENIAGIIGNDFVKSQVLIINNETHELRISPAIDKNEYETEMSFDFDKNRIYIPVKITLNEKFIIQPRLLIDLGCSDAVILNTNYYNEKVKKHIIEAINYSILHGGALGGNSNGGDFRASSLCLEKNEITNPIISFSTDTLGAFSNTHYDGLLGNEILDRFNYAIDYSNKKLYFRPNKNIKKPFISSLCGFYPIKRNGFATVESIYYQSEAYKKGLQLGDTITEINHKKIGDITDEEMYKYLKRQNKEVSVTMLKGGKSVNITITLRPLI